MDNKANQKHDNYILNKAKHAYELHKQGKAFKKVYAIVEKNNKYVVLQSAPNRKYKYELAGGGVENNETNETAIKRELLEELNMNVEIVKSLGVCEYVRTWKYNDESFDIKYVSEIYLTKFLSYGEYKTFGLDGEFTSLNIESTAEISKKEMLQNVAEFITFGVKF